MSNGPLKEYVLLKDEKDTSGVKIFLWRYTGNGNGMDKKPRKPVLLLHGASGNRRTFTFPDTLPDDGLAKWLSRDFDPWLLEWRGSGEVVDKADPDSLSKHGEAYNFNLAAQYDVPRAIRTIRKETGAAKVSALGFCMGSGVLAEAVALGHVTDDCVDRVVLMTLGLFYETPIDGRLKTEERLLERLHGSSTGKNAFLFVDPRMESDTALLKSWPDDLEALYKGWPDALRSHTDGDVRPLDRVTHTCNRLCFMYGTIYHHENLVDEVHAKRDGTSVLEQMFGAIPLQMYIHGARNIRQGQATSFDHKRDARDFVSDEALERFRRLEKVTLITGALNRLWHRDSIDRMYEWLTRGSAAHLSRFHKRVLPTYGHQDLLWGTRSAADVLPEIRKGLT
jgi:pimeloyl-ACP methyl ester carboxylesterase